MISVMTWLQAGALMAAAASSRSASTAMAARRRALLGVGASALVAVTTVVLRWSLGGGLSPDAAGFMLVISVIGVTAVAMSPTSETSPATFSHMVLLIAGAILFVSTTHPIAMAALWGATALVLWWELRSTPRTRPIARLFGAYQLTSVALFGAGAVLLHVGRAEAAVIPLLLAILIREAIIPGHSWFPPLIERAPMGAAVAFVGPQLGVYAYFRFGSGDALAMHEAATYGIGVAALTAVVAAALAAIQPDARRSIAFLIMSQSALIALGLEHESTVAHVGALLTWQVVALATSALAMTVSALAARRGHLLLAIPSGNFIRTPRMAVAFLVLGFASVGLPFTLGFVAEDVLVQGTVHGRPLLVVVLVVATALNGIAVMRSFFALFSGSSSHRGEVDLTTREVAVITFIVALLLLGGALPEAAVALVASP